MLCLCSIANFQKPDEQEEEKENILFCCIYYLHDTIKLVFRKTILLGEIIHVHTTITCLWSYDLVYAFQKLLNYNYY